MKFHSLPKAYIMSSAKVFGMYRRERVNERDVPESQHTIFVRGLPGTMTTDEIRTFFDKEGASGCSFDFVKVSPCRTKLYVAVRFDSKTIAREIMDKFSTDGQMMGYNVEMSWFRDIRRYLAHCAKQGIRPSRFREDIGGGGGGGSRRDFRGSRDNYRGGGRDRSKSPLRSPIRSRSHSRTRSQSNNSPTQRSRSYTRSPERGGQQTTDGGGGTDRSPSRSRSVHSRRTKSPADARSAHSRSRSKSSSVHSSPRSDKVKSSLLDYGEIKKERVVKASPSPPPRKSKRKKERKERKKRRYSSSPSMSPPPPAQNKHDAGSDMEASDGEIRTPPKKKQPQQQANGQPPAESPQSQQQQQQAAPTMTMTSNKQIGPFKPSAADEQQPPPFQPFAHRHLPVTAAQQQQQQQQLQANEAAMAAANSQHQQNQQVHQQNQQAHLQQQQMHSLQQHSQQPLPDSSSGAGGGGYVMQQPHSQQQQPQNQQQNKFRQTFKVDLGLPPNFPPSFKPIIDNVQQQQQPPPGIVYQTVNGGTKAKEDAKRPRVDEPSPPPPAVLRNPNKALSPMRESGPLAANVFKDIQRHILQEVRYKAQPEPEEESLGGLRLSALSKQRVTEEMREEKVANLSAELRERVNKKKRQLELSYRHDCETFGLVTRKLIEKDRSLEDRLKVALLETMKDLEGETMKQLDEFLDQLSYICA